MRGSGLIKIFCFETPLGKLSINEINGVVVSLNWSKKNTPLKTGHSKAVYEVKKFIAGKSKKFSIPYKITSKEKSRKILKNVCKIPYGQTKSYKEIALLSGYSPREVGRACALNCLPIIVPCHRVVRSDGKMGGYSGRGGIKTKIKLINIEKRNA